MVVTRRQVAESVPALIHTLTRMESLFGTCLVNITGEQRESPPISLYVPYTDTEEAWIQLQLKHLQSQNLAVTVPTEFHEEYLDLLKT